MHLSPSEFFILGRIMAVWRFANSTKMPPYWGSSLMATVEHVFEEFGLEHVSPPACWGDVVRRSAPSDTAWKRVEGWKPRFQSLGHMDGVIPGVPSQAMGVSVSEPNLLFVERVDGDTCAWAIQRPLSGLYLVIMHWLQRWAAVSPQLWLVMNEGSWPAVVEEWRTLVDFVRTNPHVPFAADTADEVEQSALREACESGCEMAFNLGGLSAEIEARLASLAERVQQADAFRRHDNDHLGDPEELLRDALAEAVATISCETAQQLCRSDDGTYGFYESARKAVAIGDGPFGGVPAIPMCIRRAHGRALQASSYLYGTFRAERA
jgi:hypothetical protein